MSLVQFKTNHGDFTIKLNEELAPISSANFLEYVNSGHYNGTIFHRVIPNFMVQGGGMEPGMTQKETRDEIENEAQNGLKNVRGSVAMARTNDPHSASSQFFINVVDNDFLNHTCFGKVIEGMDVIDAIRKVPTGSSGFHQDVPVEDVLVIEALAI